MAKRKIGRPFLQLDEEQIRELARIQCTMGEIASVMRCNIDTLTDRYSDIIKNGREDGKCSLRRAQYNKAVNEGNPALLIWLGKHYLDQRDEFKLSTSQEPEVKQLMYALKKMGTPD